MEQRKFRMPTAYTILFCLIILVAVTTWFIPAGSYDYLDGSSRSPAATTPSILRRQGAGAVLKAAFSGFYDAVDVCVFILMVGGFLGVVMKTGAIDAGVSNVIARLQGKESWLIAILMVFFGLGGHHLRDVGGDHGSSFPSCCRFSWRLVMTRWWGWR